MYFIGNTRDVFTPKEFLGSGKEGNVYYKKNTNEAVKIYNGSDLNHKSLNEETAKFLSGIPTTNILLPKRLVYDEQGSFIGYTTPFIQTYQGVNNLELLDFKIPDLIKVIEPLYRDAYTLSMNKIYLRDIYSDGNCLYNGNFYLIDPGLYQIMPHDKMEILKYNFLDLNGVLNIYVLQMKIFDMETEMIKRGDYYNICDYLRDEGRPGETFASLARRMG